MLEKVSVDMKALAKSEILSSDINVAFDCSGKKRVQYSVADFPAVFFHISYWYLSWNTAGGGNCI